MKYDVIVVGGGPSGICAAISAARQGVKTLLVEQNGFCGGMATAGLVGPFMTCYDSKGEKMIIKGLFEEIVDRTRPVRRLMYSFDSLLSDKYEQFDFFTDIEKMQKEKSLVKRLLQIRDKYGKNAILRGIDYLPNATQSERNCQIGGHRIG